MMIDNTNELEYNLSNKQPITMNIAVVGNNCPKKLSFINFWISNGEEPLNESYIYTKIFWLNKNPIQINIYDISKNNYNNITNELFHAIVYLCEIQDTTYILSWMNKMDNFSDKNTYQTVIALSNSSTNNILDKNSIVSEICSFDCPQKMTDVINNIVNETLNILDIHKNKQITINIFNDNNKITNNNNDSIVINNNNIKETIIKIDNANPTKNNKVNKYIEDEYIYLNEPKIKHNNCIIF